MTEDILRETLLHTVEFSKNQLEKIFDHLEPMCLVNQELNIIRLNKPMSEFLERDFKHCIGKPLHKLFFQWDSTFLPRNINLVLSSRRPIQINDYEIKALKAWFEITFYPVSLQNQSQGECIIIFKNVTELFLTKKMLLAQYKKLEDQKTVVDNKHALLMETKRSLERANQLHVDDLNVAREVQSGIMPENLPEFPGVDFYASYEPIRQVGGDIYDILDLGDNKLGIFIGDVSGHGLAAALVGAMVKMALVDHAYKIHSPKALFSVMNRNLIQHLKSGHYLTAFYGILNLADHSFLYSKASHPQPIMIREDGKMERLETGGMFLGMIDSPGYEEKMIQLQKGDKIYFFTDGYFEIRNKNGKQFLYTGLSRIIKSVNHLPIEQAHARMLDGLREYSEGEELEDDRTFVIMELTGESLRQRMPLLGYFNQREDVLIWVFSKESEFNALFSKLENFLLKEVASEELRKQISICIIELANNALEHGNRGDTTKSVQMAYSATQEIFKFSIRDEGEGFHPGKLKDPRIQGNWQKERGRGIFIVQSYMDEVFFHQEGSTVTMIKYFLRER